MKKEAKAVFKKYVEGFLIHYSSEDEANIEALKITFNQFSENYFYGDYDNNLQSAFGQFMIDNYEPYYSDMKEVLVEAGYPSTKPNGEEWSDQQIFSLWSYGCYQAITKILADNGFEYAIGCIRRRKEGYTTSYQI